MKCGKCSKPISDDDWWQSRRDYHILNMFACWDCVKKYLLEKKKAGSK